jgi:hypothetical protein
MTPPSAPRDSLFGHLAARFVTSEENLATEALSYILSSSSVARAVFVDYLTTLLPGLPTDLSFRTQEAGEGGEIPDMVGTDAEGREVIVVEAKFWAGLTDNQPVAYLKRLLVDSPGMLLFVAPEARVLTLWPELLRRCADAKLELTKEETSRGAIRAQVNRTHRLALTSWQALIGVIDARLAAKGEEATRGDLHQLDGLCTRMDRAAFRPLRSADLAPEIGLRISQYCELVEDVVRQLKNEGAADTSGLSCGGGLGGYWRFFRVRGYGCYVGVVWLWWSGFAETPLWLAVGDQKFRNATPEIHTSLSPLERQNPPRLMMSPEGELLVPLILPLHVERATVVTDLARQIREVAALLPAKLPGSGA